MIGLRAAISPVSRLCCLRRRTQATLADCFHAVILAASSAAWASLPAPRPLAWTVRLSRRAPASARLRASTRSLEASCERGSDSQCFPSLVIHDLWDILIVSPRRNSYREAPSPGHIWAPNSSTHTFSGNAINRLISDVFSWTVDSHVFRHALYVPGSHMCPRNRVLGQRKLTDRAGIRAGKPTFFGLRRHSRFSCSGVTLLDRRLQRLFSKSEQTREGGCAQSPPFWSRRAVRTR